MPEAGTDASFQASFMLNVDDLLALSMTHAAKSKSQQRARKMVPVFGVLAAIVALLLAVLAQSDVERQFFVVLAVLVLLVTVLFYVIYPRVIRASTRNAYREGANRMLLSPTSVHVGERFEVTHEGYGRAEVEWQGVDRVVATDDHVFVYVSALGAHIVPRRGFDSDDTFRKFAAFVEQKVSAAQGSPDREAG